MLKKKKMAKKSEKPQEVALTVEEIEREIKKALDRNADNLTSEEKAAQVEALKRVFIDGQAPGESLGIGKNILEQIYNRAYERYNLGLYKEANHMFRLLCLLDPETARFHLGLAATNHRLGLFDIAVPIYYAAWFLDVNSPIPLVYCSDCYVEMNQPGAARVALQMAANVCGDKPEYEKLKTRCLQMMDGLKKDKVQAVEKEG